MNVYVKYGLVCLTAMTVIACMNEETEYEKQMKKADDAIASYLEDHNIDAKKASTGVYVEVLEENEDGRKINNNDIVSVLYEMYLLSGEEVEIYHDTLNPVLFSHSSNALIPAGLNYEIDHMRRGETFRFYIPFYRAFEQYAHGGLFDVYANFMMQVTVMDVKNVDQQFEMEVDSIKSYLETNEIDSAEQRSSGLFYIPVKEGDGTSPQNHNHVKLHFTRTYLDGTVIETTVGQNPLTVRLSDDLLVAGFTEGVKLMKKGGEAVLIMPSELAFGKSLQVIPQEVRKDWEENNHIEPKTRPFSPVIYEVELLEVY